MSELPTPTSPGQPVPCNALLRTAGTAASDTGAPVPTASSVRPTDAGPTVTLAEVDIEAIATRVAELIHHPPHRLLKVDEVATLLAVDAAFVYAHQRELGVLRLPTRGRRPALRFDRDAVLELLRQRTASRAPVPPKRRPKPPQRRTPAGIELLPYEPRSAA